MVLAGPGSGKTTVITHRILRLIHQHGVRPSNILVITFTKAAAVEMEARFCKLLKQSPEVKTTESVVFGTFHSVFFHILKQNYHFSHKNIVGEREKLLIMQELIEKEKLDTEDKDFYQQVLAEISLFKSEQKPLKDFESHLLEQESFQRVYQGYQKRLKERRQLDFDDMMQMCWQLLQKRPEELRIWQDKYQYILVDEFQDINQIQYDVVRLLAAPQNNLFIVGDDDQSIYRFRGARPEIMLGFETDFKKAVRIRLGNNYRSRREIVDYAGAVIQNNHKRFPKEIQAVRGSGGSVEKHCSQDIPCENVQVVEEIRRAAAAGVPLDEIAVLYRTNTTIRPLLEELVRKQLPYVLREKVQNIYDHFIAQDLMAYVRLSLGKGTRGDFLRVMNKPLRYISRELVTSKTINFRALMQHYRGKPEMQARTERFLRDLNTMRRLPTAAALIYIRKKIGYETYLDDFAIQNRIETTAFHDIMDELEAVALNHPDKEEWLRYIEVYSQTLMQTQRPEEEHGVRLLTYHASKGLEFHTVHMIDCVEGLTPYKKAASEDDLEEERRMFYVACTRAKEHLHIYVTNTRYSKACNPSRFVPEGEKHGKQRKFWNKLIRRGADDRHADT